MKLKADRKSVCDPRGERRRHSQAGVTLVEVMVAMLVFVMVAIGITTSLIQLRRQGENNISQVLAQAIAEGLLEQVRRTSYSDLSDVDTNPPVQLLFIDANIANNATVQPFSLAWATDDTTYTEIGVRTDPTDLTSPILGMLMDVDYKDASGNLIRARRYMKMKVNLRHSLNANKDAVEVRLKYQWAVPERRNADWSYVYFPSREIRSVVSKIPTY